MRPSVGVEPPRGCRTPRRYTSCESWHRSRDLLLHRLLGSPARVLSAAPNSCRVRAGSPDKADDRCGGGDRHWMYASVPARSTRLRSEHCSGERLLRKLQLEASRRTAGWRDLLFSRRSSHRDRGVARPPHYSPVARVSGLPATRAAGHPAALEPDQTSSPSTSAPVMHRGSIDDTSEGSTGRHRSTFETLVGGRYGVPPKKAQSTLLKR